MKFPSKRWWITQGALVAYLIAYATIAMHYADKAGFHGADRKAFYQIAGGFFVAGYLLLLTILNTIFGLEKTALRADENLKVILNYRQGPPLRRQYVTLYEGAVEIRDTQGYGDKVRSRLRLDEIQPGRSEPKTSPALGEYYLGLLATLSLAIIAGFYVEERQWIFGLLVILAPLFFVWHRVAKQNKLYQWQLNNGSMLVISKDGNSHIDFENFCARLEAAIAAHAAKAQHSTP